MSNFKIRKNLLKKIAKSRNSVVISYITGDRPRLETQISPEVIDIFVEHLDKIGPVPKISLVLHTNGGDTSAAWRLINLIHTFCDEFEVIIPSKALSAGTLISLGANKVVMTKQAALGPIDPSLNHPLSPIMSGPPGQRVPVSVEAVRGYIDAAKDDLGINDPAVLGNILVDLANKVHPLVLGQIFRTRSQIRILASKLLSRQVKNKEKLKKIIDFLCAESGSHDYTVNRREAEEMGLAVEKPSEDLYATIHALHQSYCEEMQLLVPYDPYSLVATCNEFQYTFVRAAIESLAIGAHQFVSEGLILKTTLSLPDQFGNMNLQESIKDMRKFEGWRKTK